MPITVTCDQCSEPHRVRDDAVEKQFACKGCGKSLRPSCRKPLRKPFMPIIMPLVI